MIRDAGGVLVRALEFSDLYVVSAAVVGVKIGSHVKSIIVKVAILILTRLKGSGLRERIG